MPAVTIKSDGSDLKDKLLDKYVHAGQLVDGILFNIFYSISKSAIAYDYYTLDIQWRTTDSQIIINIDADFQQVKSKRDEWHRIYVFTKGETKSYFDSFDFYFGYNYDDGTWYRAMGIADVNNSVRNVISIVYTISHGEEINSVDIGLLQLDFNNKITVELV